MRQKVFRHTTLNSIRFWLFNKLKGEIFMKRIGLVLLSLLMLASCGGASIQIGDVTSLMVKDIGTHETAPSDIQTVK